MTRIVSAALCLLCACGADLYEPHPPQLERVTVAHRTDSVPEPFAVQLIGDLFVPQAADCAAAQAWLAHAISAAVEATAGATLLPPQWLGCDHAPARRIDVNAIQAAFASAAAAHPQAHYRLLAIYANDVDAALPALLLADLKQLRDALHPWMWSLAHGNAWISPDRAVAWTYWGDAALAQAISAAAAADLPFVTEVGATAGPLPLLGDADRARALAFKVCARDPGAAVSVIDGAAAPPDPAPTVSYSAQGAVGVPRSRFAPRELDVDVELCTASCDRFFDYRTGGAALPWDRAPGCALRRGAR